MIRVLHVVNWLRFGGVETQLLRILRGYDRTGFHMDVCVIGDEIGYLADEFQSLGADIISCPKSINLLSFSARFTKVITGRNYDVVHSHLWAWGGAILRGAYLARVPVRIALNHSVWPFTQNPGEPVHVKMGKSILAQIGSYWVRRYSTQVMAVSEEVANAHWARTWGSDRVVIWTGGVDTEEFKPAVDGEEKDGQVPKIIWVGGLHSTKRIDLQLRVLRLVLRAIPEARLVLVGDGNEKTPLLKSAEDLGVASSVEFLGTKPNIAELLRSATLFLSCSEGEGLPTVLMEAQAVGLPVVASDIGPHREVLAPDLHPFLFNLECPEKGAVNVSKLLSDAKLRRRLGLAARQFVVERFNAATQLKRLEDYYTQWVGLGKPFS